MANTIRIKRGLKADLTKMTLLAGELGIALDTQELYVGDTDGNVKIVKGGASGAVESADKLTIARTISATGDVTGSTSFDGSQNVEMALQLANSGVAAGTYTKVTVDEKGRITAGSNITVEDIGDLSTTLSGLATKKELEGYVKTETLTAELTKKVDKVEGKSLIDDTEITRLASVKNYDDTDIKASIATKANSADVYSITDMDTKLGLKADKSALDTLTETVNGKANAATTLTGYGITDAYTKTEVDAKVASVYKYKGSVANEEALPTEGQVVGDVYNLEDTGMNVAWTGEGWDKLGSVVDLSLYLTKEDAGKTYATKATTLAGYGITDAYTTTAVDDLLANKLDATSVIDGGTF